jgi:exosortase
LAALVCLALYFIWPYQHWQFTERGSVMEGWRRLLAIEPEWWFCFAVPGVVAFLVYRIRGVLVKLPVQGSWWGLPLAALSLLFYWVGYKVDTGYMGFVSIQLMVAALILMLGGRAWMRALFFPWLFLLFMWPMFPLEGLMASPLRTLTAKLSSGLLNLIGIPVVRVGTGLHSAPDFAKGLQEGDRFMLDVADPCSGIRSLFALIMLAALYGHLALKRAMPRLLLFLSALPLAVAGNLVRLVLLAVGSVFFGQSFAIGTVVGNEQHESFYHELCGYIVFAVALGGMFGLASIWEGKHWKRVKWLEAPVPAPTPDAAEATARPMLLRMAALTLIAALGLFTCAFTSTTPKLAEPGLIMDLPATVDGYQGIAMEMSAYEKELFVEGVTLKRRFYAGPENRRIMATLVMSGPVKKSLHEPSRCLPDQGWTIADTEVVPVHLDDGRELEVSLMHVYRDKEIAPGQRVRVRGLNAYWYQGSHGVSTPSYAMSHTHTYFDAIFRNLNHRWGQVAVFMPVSEHPIGQDDPLEEIAAREALLEFLAKLTPKILV